VDDAPCGCSISSCDVLFALVIIFCWEECCMGGSVGYGAEVVVLGGNEGLFGVDGSSEVDGDNVESWE